LTEALNKRIQPTEERGKAVEENENRLFLLLLLKLLRNLSELFSISLSKWK
jgi:hypothetical protein